ncbi:MAG: hypothetical protein Ct9H300mP19_16020 [Dehalococcoidia bacterium]|nr:MAG: hypothetical protein Ct9H300mP19_16020 [Dehalococcoidia bacterium]
MRTLYWWEDFERRHDVRKYLKDVDGVDPEDVIMSPDRASEKKLTSTVTFPRGNIAPEGSVIKSTAIDPSVVDSDGVYRKVGPARVFRSERAAMGAIKSRDDEHKIKAGDIMVVTWVVPLGPVWKRCISLKAASSIFHMANT